MVATGAVFPVQFLARVVIKMLTSDIELIRHRPIELWFWLQAAFRFTGFIGIFPIENRHLDKE